MIAQEIGEWFGKVQGIARMEWLGAVYLKCPYFERAVNFGAGVVEMNSGERGKRSQPENASDNEKA